MNETILVVDDEIMITTTLATLIKATTKYNIISSNNPVNALELLKNNHDIKMVISDFMMPEMNGLEFLHEARTSNSDLILILLTGYADKENAIKSINEVGLYYYIEKPWDNNTLIKILKNGFEKSKLTMELKQKIEELKDSHRVIQRMYDFLQKDYKVETDNMQNIIISLANIIEAKDKYTDGHTRRVGKLSKVLALKLGFNEEEADDLETAGIIHDIGKIGVSEKILNKPGKLTDDEYESIKKHSLIGENICKPLNCLKNCLDPIRHHHEKLNGSGYPDGLKGDEVSLRARIVAVADIFDALYSKRPYRDKLEINKVKEIMYTEVENNLLDSKVVKTLFESVEKKEVDDIIND